MSSSPEALVRSLAPAAPSNTRGAFLPARLLLLAAATALCCALSAAGALIGPLALAFAIAAIAVAMAHGAYDHLQGQRLLTPRFGPRWPLPFLAGYLLLIALTLLAWRVFPLASLVFFLAYSSWHFGLEPEIGAPSRLRIAAGLALGALPIAAACRWHPAEVAPIFAQMLGPAASGAAPLTHALGAAGLPVAAFAVLAVATGQLDSGDFRRSRPSRTGQSFEGVPVPEGTLTKRLELAAATALQLALFFFCNPLIAFAVFFCCWHTPEHLLATSLPGPGSQATLQRNLAQNLRAAFGPWLLALAALGGAFAFGKQGLAAHEGQLFVLLSALTVPHMALDELRRIQKSPNP